MDKGSSLILGTKGETRLFVAGLGALLLGAWASFFMQMLPASTLEMPPTLEDCFSYWSLGSLLDCLETDLLLDASRREYYGYRLDDSAFSFPFPLKNLPSY